MSRPRVLFLLAPADLRRIVADAKAILSMTKKKAEPRAISVPT